MLTPLIAVLISALVAGPVTLALIGARTAAARRRARLYQAQERWADCGPATGPQPVQLT